MIAKSAFDFGYGGYGGVIDSEGVLWSTTGGAGGGALLRLTPPTYFPSSWQPAYGILTTDGLFDNGDSITPELYGIAVDPVNPFIWQSAREYVVRWPRANASYPTDGSISVCQTGNFPNGREESSTTQGLAVDNNGHVWVAHGPNSHTVGHLSPNGELIGNVDLDAGLHPTGVSIDSNGKIWVSNMESHNAMRIDPAGGSPIGVDYHVGAVDMVVDLGNGTQHPLPYNKPAEPYNYSDMTGFNNRIVNPSQTPFKGYWVVIEDSQAFLMTWNSISWNPTVQPNGCGLEVYVRACDDRLALSHSPFVKSESGQLIPGVKGRYIEVRVALSRDDGSKQPTLDSLTLNGTSSTLTLEKPLKEAQVYEGSTAVFQALATGIEPLSYKWYAQYPWSSERTLISTATSSEYRTECVDSWDDETQFSVEISDASGETLAMEPVRLDVIPTPIVINESGPAEVYPAKIEVFGQSTTTEHVEVSLMGLSHTYPADLDILLVGPNGKKIMLMSDACGFVPLVNSTLIFKSSEAPEDKLPYYYTGYNIPSNSTWGSTDYDDQQEALPNVPDGPFVSTLEELYNNNPNGIWELYIYDDSPGGGGVLHDSWRLKFVY